MFFFDHSGCFIPSEYVVGLLAEVFLNKEKGATIIHDPRVIWNTIDVVHRCEAGYSIKTGHTHKRHYEEGCDLRWRCRRTTTLRTCLLRQWGHSLVAGGNTSRCQPIIGINL